jgi:hypothetical protein
MSNNPDTDPEELLQQSKEQSRHTSEPSETSSSDEQTVNRVTAIKEALIAIDDGDAPENINLRDARLKGLLVGLSDTGELSQTATELETVVDGDTAVSTDNASQSDVARLLLRVGLQAALPDLLEDAKEARKQKVLEDADEY